MLCRNATAADFPLHGIPARKALIVSHIMWLKLCKSLLTLPHQALNVSTASGLEEEGHILGILYILMHLQLPVCARRSVLIPSSPLSRLAQALAPDSSLPVWGVKLTES
jgi:hypothetical protein